MCISNLRCLLFVFCLGPALVCCSSVYGQHAKQSVQNSLLGNPSSTFPTLPDWPERIMSLVVLDPDQSNDNLPANGGQFLGDNGEYPYAPFTSMTQVAELFAPPTEPTWLCLNFDGHDGEFVNPFVTTTGNRRRDIQQIMFQVSQTFAPFNVRLFRYSENGQMAKFGGHTTIFVGDKLENTDWAKGAAGNYIQNKKRAFADGDYPCPNSGVMHQPNSDLFNDGFVDPISYTSYDNETVLYYDQTNNDDTAQTICHEAGHTFGVAHVLGNVMNPDLMSYSSENLQSSFAELNLTSLNGSEIDEGWAASWFYLVPTDTNNGIEIVENKLATQNSYRVLAATLGMRNTTGDTANIARPMLADAMYIDGSQRTILRGQTKSDVINDFGDFDVFDFLPDTSQYISVTVTATDAANWFNPSIQVYDGGGEELLSYGDNDFGSNTASAVFKPIPGRVYKLVVGGLDCTTFGSYQLSAEIADSGLDVGASDELTIGVDNSALPAVTKNSGLRSDGELVQAKFGKATLQVKQTSKK